MSQEIIDALGEHLGGGEIYGDALAKLKKRVPAAWKIWDDDTKAKWAVFVLAGKVLPTSDAKSIRKARPNLRVLLVAQKYENLAAAASIYREITPHILYPIAGKLTLIPPPPIVPAASPKVAAPSRVTLDLLKSVSALGNLPKDLVKSIKALAAHYETALAAGKSGDRWEEDALLAFARSVLTQMGLEAGQIKATAMILTLERDPVEGSRDHFFHSFQNYFLGLTAISQLREEFLSFKALAKVNWDIEPANVWFLTALWHDVGYSIQKYGTIYSGAFGDQEDEEQIEIKKEAINRLLHRPQAQTGIRVISSLMARLLKPKAKDAKTGWLAPGASTLLSDHAQQVEKAIHRNILKSHGALSAIRLFVDYMDDIEKMDEGRQLLLKQTVYLACASMPFHDFWFRMHVREECSECKMPVGALPFGALLAFVDSIQDDRRDIEAVKEAVLILKTLLIQAPATVEADISMDGLNDEKLLDKIMEGRDVLAALEQKPNTLQFKYPSWVAA
jgi:hypothetical protein